MKRDATSRAVAKATPKRKERDIQREILRLLHAHGVRAWGMQREAAGKKRASHIGVKGMADIWGWRCDDIFTVPVLIEVKRPGEKMTNEQRLFIESARKDGCIAFSATSCEDVCREMGYSIGPCSEAAHERERARMRGPA